MSFRTSRYSGAIWVLACIAAVSLARTAMADDVGAIRTKGEGWFESCWAFVISVCNIHPIKLPEVLTVGDILDRHSTDYDFGPFEVTAIEIYENGNCFLYNNSGTRRQIIIMWGQALDVIYLGKCEILDTQIPSVFLRQALGHADSLGQVTGISSVCADALESLSEEAIAWIERTLILHQIQIAYVEQVEREDKAAAFVVDLAFSDAYLYQTDDNRDTILKDAQRCRDSAAEVDRFIYDWKQRLELDGVHP